jgi:hypothetical protein
MKDRLLSTRPGSCSRCHRVDQVSPQPKPQRPANTPTLADDQTITITNPRPRPSSINFLQCENRTAPDRYTRGATHAAVRGFDMRFAFLIVLLLATSPVAAQTAGTSTSQVCTQDPTYCSDTGAEPSTTTNAGTSSSTSSGGSGGGSSGGSSSGGGAGATPAVPNSPCGDGFPVDAWGGCN